jgi:hypothetical protein
MSEHKYLYEIAYSCGHTLWERLDAPLSREEYYARVAGKCPACQAVVDKAEALLRARMGDMLPPEEATRWEERRRPCPVCGEMRVLIDTVQGVMCRECRRARGLLDGKQGVCDVCGRKLTLHYTGAAMVCRHCWEGVTGKKAPADWAKSGPKKDGRAAE